VRRRVVVGGLAALGLLRGEANADVAKLPRIGVLSGGSTELGSAQVQVFRNALAQAGYRDGETVVIDVRYAAGDHERFTALARELVASSPDVIACVGRIETAALQAATQTIPIVFMQAPNPLELGLVKSLAHPGGNTTGFTQMSTELDSKRLQLLHELMPQATRVAFLINPTFLPGIEARFAEAKSLAQSAGIDLQRVAVTAPAEVEVALEASRRSGAQALLIQNDPILGGTAVKHIAGFAMAHRLPAIAEDRTEYGRWHLAHLRQRPTRKRSVGGRLCGADSHGRETRRSAGATPDEIRADHQFENRPGTGHRRPPSVACAGR
jgi:putative tryptophan/tyrosine transport system substrate-binding protein